MALALTIFSYSMIKLLTETVGPPQTAFPAMSVLPLLAIQYCPYFRSWLGSRARGLRGSVVC